MPIQVISIALFIIIFPFAVLLSTKKIFPRTFDWKEFSIAFGANAVLIPVMCALFAMGSYYDTEIWNGVLTAKERQHGHYVDSVEHCSGSGEDRDCTTEYIDHYTVDWYVYGDFISSREVVKLHSLDRTSRSVYDSPDPYEYTNAKIGEHMSVSKMFANYVLIDKDSLFNTNLVTSYQDKMPGYPSINNYYKFTRVIDTSGKLFGAENVLNDKINDYIKTLGGQLQVNPIVVITDILDPSYFNQLENHWIGGKKNDAVLVLGIDDAKNVKWADVFTYGHTMGNEYLQANLRKEVSSIGLYDSDKIALLLKENLVKYYKRVEMEKFEYLKAGIKVPMYGVIITIIISLLGTCYIAREMSKN